MPSLTGPNRNNSMLERFKLRGSKVFKCIPNMDGCLLRITKTHTVHLIIYNSLKKTTIWPLILVCSSNVHNELWAKVLSKISEHKWCKTFRQSSEHTLAVQFRLWRYVVFLSGKTIQNFWSLLPTALNQLAKTSKFACM